MCICLRLPALHPRVEQSWQKVMVRTDRKKSISRDPDFLSFVPCLPTIFSPRSHRAKQIIAYATTMTTPQSALQELREALRSPVPTVDDFVFHLSSTLDALGIQQGKVVGAVAVGGSGAVKAIGRSMGSIQQALLHTAVPTFLHALDDRGRELLDTFFAPRPASQSATDAAIRTHIALAAYQTFSAQLSARPGLAPLPLVSRTYVLDVLDSLARNYRLEEIYGAIWSRVKDGAESSKEACSKQLMWEDMVRVLVSLPAKVGNVVGQWNVERWKGDIPERLQPK